MILALAFSAIGLKFQRNRIIIGTICIHFSTEELLFVSQKGFSITLYFCANQTALNANRRKAFESIEPPRVTYYTKINH